MVSGIITSVLLLLFLGGWAWVWSPRRRAEFDAAANLPFDDTDAATDASAQETER